MCSIVIVRGVWSDTPLLVCANRDEDLRRPAEGLAHRRFGVRPVVAPLDLKAGGTWLGTNDVGLFVGITNRFGPPDPNRRSRGELVTRTLDAETVDEARQILLALPPERYNPCHMVLASTDAVVVLVNDGHQWCEPEHDPHVAIVTERSFGAAPTTRDGRLRAALDRWLTAPQAPGNDAVVATMGTHAEPTFEGMCVHWDERGYGTRTLTVVRCHPSGELDHYSTDGPPCTAPLRRFGEL